jgi:pimeloyl-ACP methyl ester carboxylesterase
MLRAVFCTVPKDVEERFRVGSGWQWIKGVIPRSTAVLALGRRLGLPEQRRRFLQHIRVQAERTPVPMLVIWGENDRMLPSEHTREIQAVLPEAEVAIFAHTGHHPPLEDQTGFHRRIVDFLEKNGL